MSPAGRGLAGWLAASAVLLAACGRGGPPPLLVAAASDLRPAFSELAAGFEQRTGQEVTLSFGSSGRAAQQVLEGAPIDVFASADARYVDEVVEAGRADPATRTVYATGRIVLWAREDRWGGWAGLADVAADAAVATVAIANPDHAPYGRAAREALEHARLWSGLRPRVVLAENVADAQRLAATGNADAAVIALSLALAGDLGRGMAGTWTLVHADTHAPLEQALVVVASDPERARTAREFVEHVTGSAGRDVLGRYGFAVPGGRQPPSWSSSR